MSHKGYDLGRITNPQKLDMSLMGCKKCKQVMDNPTMCAKCSQHFCYECLRESLKK